MRVITNLHTARGTGFTKDDGWELKEWPRFFNEVIHRTLYLIHSTTGHITNIKSHYKAYNDYIRMAMMIQLI